MKAAEDIHYVDLTPRPVLPLIEETAQAVDLLQDIKAARKEHVLGLYLNARHELLHKEIVSIGTVNASLVHPRDHAQCHRGYRRSQSPERGRNAVAGGYGSDAQAKGGGKTARHSGA